MEKKSYKEFLLEFKKKYPFLNKKQISKKCRQEYKKYISELKKLIKKEKQEEKKELKLIKKRIKEED
jgi:hypothetical protein